MLMDPTEADKARGVKTPIWDEYKKLVDESEGKIVGVSLIERFDFYKRACLLYTSPSPRDKRQSRMPSSA